MAKDASRRLPAEERRAQLVAAALGLAEAEGFGAVTIRRVADAAGVSLGVVHYCFENKEELMGAAIANVVAALGEEISQTYARASEASEAGTGAEGLRQLLGDGLAAMWALIEQTPQLQILTYEITTYALRLAAENPDGARALADALGATGISLTGEVAPGIPDGTLSGGRLHGHRIVTKAGGFGAPDALLTAVAAVRHRRYRS